MRKKRSGELGEEPLESILHRLETDWLDLFIIEIHDELLPFVKSLIWKYPLKGADSVHLASALWLEGTTKAGVMFVASDMNLLDAATKENPKNIESPGKVKGQPLHVLREEEKLILLYL